MSIGAKETEIRYWTDYANSRDGICFRKEDALMLVHEHYELERIKAENAKLRELVCHMLTCATNVDFDGSPACQVCSYDRDGDRSACDFGRRAQELRIEVD